MWILSAGQNSFCGGYTVDGIIMLMFKLIESIFHIIKTSFPIGLKNIQKVKELQNSDRLTLNIRIAVRFLGTIHT